MPSESLRETVQQFGFPTERFLPGRGPARVLRIVGIFDALLGIGVTGWALATGQDWVWTLAGVLLFISGVVPVLLARRLSTGGVLLCPRGLIFAKPGYVDSVQWEQFRAIREEKLGGDGTSLIVVERKDGTSCPIDAATVGDLARFAAALRKETERKRIPWKTD